MRSNANHGSIYNGVIHIDKGQIARDTARRKAAKPPTTRKINDKRKKAAKHRKPLQGED